MVASQPTDTILEAPGTSQAILPSRLALPFSERRVLLFLGDVLLLGLAALNALWGHALLRREFAPGPPAARDPVVWILLLGGLWVLLAIVNECYDLHVAHHRVRITRSILVSAAEIAVLYLVLFFIFGRQADAAPWLSGQQPAGVGAFIPPRVIAALFLLLATTLTMGWRIGYIRLCTSFPLRPRIMVVGAGRSGQALVRAVREVVPDYQIVGFIDDDPARRGRLVDGLPVLGSRHDLLRQARANGVNEIILAITQEIDSGLFKALMDCYERGIIIKPMSLLYEEALGRVPVEHLRRKWFPIPPWSNTALPTFYQAFKRLMDIGMALVGLTLLAAIFPFLALAIYLDSPGPIFYTQERLGKGGRRFRVIKLRSMIPNAERQGEAVWATRDDQRITRVGKFLRRTRLDELPQLANVLKGEMSIVGPRPERPEFVAQLQEQIPFYRTRLIVKPGLTGWAQIKYHYGSTTGDALIKLQYDLYYIKYQSLWLDLLIIFRTIRVMLAFKGM